MSCGRQIVVNEKKLIRALRGEAQETPPVWLMRQAGRYLPEYRSIRAQAGDFLSLCYTPELAAEVTLQPIRRFDFDAAILFADILLVPHALGVDLSFETGEGPRLSTVTDRADLTSLKPVDDIHLTLAPVYETLRILSDALPAKTSLIGFAGAPWTVATYMIAGCGTPDQRPAHLLRRSDPETFDILIDQLTEATISYLSAQIEAGAEVVKLFDSWAGSLTGAAFARYAVEPVSRIATSLKSRWPDVPIIAFPRGAGNSYSGFARTTGVDCVALDSAVDARWAADYVQVDGCVQGNLAPHHLVVGGPDLIEETHRIVETLSGGPYVFNLGHGITPDADPSNVHVVLEAIRG